MGCQVEILEADDQFEIYFQDTCLHTCERSPKPSQKDLRRIHRKITENGRFTYKQRIFYVGTENAGKVVEIKEYNNGKRIAIYENGVSLIDLDTTEGKPKDTKKK